MATVFERPMSALSDASSLPRQRRPSVVEVIDVDQITDVDELAPSTSSRPTRRPTMASREIIVIDSDDEDHFHGQASGNSRPARLFSPPPPAAGPSHIPPVPRVPHRFSAHTSFVPRPNGSATPPVIRPIDRPFEFGGANQHPPVATLHVHPNRHRRVNVEHRAEPEPHHIPALGLGGAIIAVNDQPHRANGRTTQRDRNRRYLHNHINVNDEQPGLFGRATQAMRRFYTTFARVSPDFEEDAFALPFEEAAAEAELFGMGNPRGVAFENLMFRRRGRDQPPEIEYKVEYTHPGQPEPGFAFSFAPPEPTPPPKTARIVIDLEASDTEDGPVAGSSKQAAPTSTTSTLQTLLVCARCTEPLVLGGSLVGEEGRRRKVWALRCGHMIDGACLEIIGSPDENGPEETPMVGKGKGKARDDGEFAATASELFASAENTVRSRLRSRVPLPPVPTMAPSPPAAPPISLGKRKRPIKPRIEATHEWKCPVINCGQLHVNVKIHGAWVPEPVKGPSGKGKGKRVAVESSTPGRGAIAVFV
ncbi:hypothetical protein DXG01_013957 [Tephrocybe rancida]|nr:hypothetical protein DXG01_013957 [Tephrocybe rancida]